MLRAERSARRKAKMDEKEAFVTRKAIAVEDFRASLSLDMKKSELITLCELADVKYRKRDNKFQLMMHIEKLSNDKIYWKLVKRD